VFIHKKIWNFTRIFIFGYRPDMKVKENWWFILFKTWWIRAIFFHTILSCMCQNLVFHGERYENSTQKHLKLIRACPMTTPIQSSITMGPICIVFTLCWLFAFVFSLGSVYLCSHLPCTFDGWVAILNFYILGFSSIIIQHTSKVQC